MLNRTIRITREGVEYESDERHAKQVIRLLELEESKSVATPRVRPASSEDDSRGEELSPKDSTKYRSIVATLNYLAHDRPDIQEAARECSKYMAKPREQDVANLKRIGRYLKKRPRVTQRFRTGGDETRIEAFADSDWAGCRET